MQREEYAPFIQGAGTRYLEPLWKTLLSNKALLPLLWQLFPGHPNLLPAYFEDDPRAGELRHFVCKPIYSREGANIAIYKEHQLVEQTVGPYSEEGYILQAWHPLPRFLPHIIL